LKKAAGILFTDGNKFLVLKDMKNVWSVPGGKREEKENSWENACRETYEETKFKPDVDTCIGKFPDLNDGKSYTTYICIIKDLFEPDLSKEHSKYKWISFEDIEDFNLHKRLKNKLPFYRKFINSFMKIKNHKFSH
jgi:8-oxo-dGTP pyrophosphatase MutT (NUDIX family)